MRTRCVPKLHLPSIGKPFPICIEYRTCLSGGCKDCARVVSSAHNGRGFDSDCRLVGKAPTCAAPRVVTDDYARMARQPRTEWRDPNAEGAAWHGCERTSPWHSPIRPPHSRRVKVDKNDSAFNRANPISVIVDADRVMLIRFRFHGSRGHTIRKECVRCTSSSSCIPCISGTASRSALLK